ncbi:MAG: hypothetical protein ABWZ77_01265 [Naasia sp.]
MGDTTSAGGACVLVPGDVRLGTTGVEVTGWLVAGGALVAAGVVVLLLVLLLRRRRSATGARVLAASVVLLSLLGLGQISPAPASAATDSGCDLIGWSMLSVSNSGVEASLSEDPTQVVAFTLKNVSNVPISIRLRTDTKSDPALLADFIEIASECSGCSMSEVYRAQMGAPEPGSEFFLAGGASVDIRVSARLLPGVSNPTQGTSATFGISAIARQI